jgi:hypothetical protein
VEDILVTLVCVNSQEFDSLCCFYAISFFFHPLYVVIIFSTYLFIAFE